MLSLRTSIISAVIHIPKGCNRCAHVHCTLWVALFKAWTRLNAGLFWPLISFNARLAFPRARQFEAVFRPVDFRVLYRCVYRN
jgi:hypothetical protein